MNILKNVTNRFDVFIGSKKIIKIYEKSAYFRFIRIAWFKSCKIFKKKNFEVYEILRKENKYKLNNKIKTIDFNSNWNTNILPKNIDIIIHLSQSNHFRNFPKFAIDIFK